jgi:hypothetical protein
VIVVFLACLLVLITQAPEASAAGVCPDPRESLRIVDCWGDSDVTDIPRCSAPWTRKQVRHCIESGAAAYSKDPVLGLAIFGAMMPPHRCSVPMVKTTGELSYVVPIIINSDYGPAFIVDTGFTGSLAIPRVFVDDLRARGVLTKDDSGGPPVTTTLADGSEIIEETIMVREIILPGCRAFRNVRVIVSPTGSVAQCLFSARVSSQDSAPPLSITRNIVSS